ncbi:Pullulanase secretion protein pulS [Klebsiella variicola]|uniref:type II secretion system pilot lipoprotein GspS n=1 Tax=Klebsiella TaxID=570 RepID=UPI000D6F1116|nr:type II secretion system pilot lipoprotein GspS [Klebsiella variicola]PZZ92142.1 pullulanase [Klebsiella variicola]UYK34417.1 type II secretion system pilot lipoprotein GspS [Klebsiella pneumoniae]SXF50385.1 Pullulanase secretion protein pulS [Klebsiella variicola]HBT5253056.1 type II secretion system pilot lipoprotein GspS [Klebsiella variicola]
MRIPLIFSLCVVAVLSGCQQKPASTLSPAISSQAQLEQLEQLSSVAAGTRYLKNKCNRSDLPADETIYRAAVNVGKARGWGNIDVATLSQNSDRLYQQLLQDSTPEATQCSQFNRQLAPFIASLRSD